MNLIIYWSCKTEEWGIDREDADFVEIGVSYDHCVYHVKSERDLWEGLDYVGATEGITFPEIRYIVTRYLKMTEQDRFQKFFHEHYRGDLPRIPEFWS